MIERVHVQSFVAFTIGVWLVVLWVQGMPVLSWKFVRPFSLVVALALGAAWGFERYAWAWPVFRDWYIKRPDLRGTWKVVLESSWVDPDTGEPKGEVTGYMVVRQTLSSLSMRMLTVESKSKVVAHGIERDSDGVYSLSAIYRNEPAIELQSTRSPIHHGSFHLEIHGAYPTALEGHYWTDRTTRGSMRLEQRSPAIVQSYEDARAWASGGERLER